MNPNRSVVLAYGIGCYLVHWATTLWFVLFVGNLWLGKTVDRGESPGSAGVGIAVDLVLLFLFVAQHWVMARAWFKQRLARWVPPVMERSTYVLMTCAALALLGLLWQPASPTVWASGGDRSRLLLNGIYLAAWSMAIAATFPINHWELFGVRQAWLYWCGREHIEPSPSRSVLYRVLPHPIFVGYGVAIWSAPHMGAAHFLLSVVLTTFLLVDVRLAQDGR